MPPCGLQDGEQNIIFNMINWNESCVACIDIWPLFWQGIDHSTLSQCTLSDYLNSIFVFLYFCTFSHIPHLHVHLPPQGLLPLLLLINSIYICVCWNLHICLNVYLHICICVFVHLPYATTPCFRQSPQLSPPCHRYCSSIAAGTQRTHRSVAEQQLAGHSCNIYFRLHKNLAQILHKYCIFINIHAQNCTIHAKIFLKYLNISPNGFISIVLCGGWPVQLGVEASKDICVTSCGNIVSKY